MTVLGGLQYPDAWCWIYSDERFNTDDGIRRATIRICDKIVAYSKWVSIPMTVLGGLQLYWSCGNLLEEPAFQYRWRYLEGYNAWCWIYSDEQESFQYRWRYLEGYNFLEPEFIRKKHAVSIPMTVFGGLQSRCHGWWLRHFRSFNTDDGIWRATIRCWFISKEEELSFQYRWRYLEGYNWRRQGLYHSRALRFNTDDGIWRATISSLIKNFLSFGEFQYRWRYLEGYNHGRQIFRNDHATFQYRWRYLEGYNLHTSPAVETK